MRVGAILRILVIWVGCFVGLQFTYVHGEEEVHPIAAWLFDEGVGRGGRDATGVLEDGSGNGRDGEIVGDVKWRRGKFGSALEFLPNEGDWGHVRVPHQEDLSLNEFTITAWLKVPSIVPPQGRFEIDAEALQMIVDKELVLMDDGGVARVKNRNYSMWIRSDGSDAGNLACGFWNRWPVKRPVETETTRKVTDNEWHFVACVYDGQTLFAYVDGKEVGKVENEDDQGIRPKLHRMEVPLYLGAQQQPQPIVGKQVFEKGIQGIGGVLDDVAIYNVGLNSEQIRSLMVGLAARYDHIRAVDIGAKLASTWGRIKAE